MTPARLKRIAAQHSVRVRIVADGCRDYVVEVLSDGGAGLLQHRRGRTLRFQSLGQIHDVLGRCGVRDVVLRQRVADEEACGGPTAASFHELPVTVRQ